MAAAFESMCRYFRGNPPPPTLTASTPEVAQRLESLCGCIRNELSTYTMNSSEESKKIQEAFKCVLPLLQQHADTLLQDTAQCATMKQVKQRVLKSFVDTSNALQVPPEAYVALEMLNRIISESRGNLIVLQGMQQDDPENFRRIMDKVYVDASIPFALTAATLMLPVITHAPVSLEEEWDDQPEKAVIAAPEMAHLRESNSALAQRRLPRLPETIDDFTDAQGADKIDAIAWQREYAAMIEDQARDTAAAARAAELGDATRLHSKKRW